MRRAAAVALLTSTWLAWAAPAPAAPRPNAPSAGSPAPGAAAWVLLVELDDTPIVEVGSTSVSPADGTARAVSMAVTGSGPPSAAASAAQPHSKASLADWTDDTGSLTVQGGYAESTVGDRRWIAHAGLGRSTGTGIAMASALLTWDQQTQLLGAVQAFNDQITPLVSQTLAALAPVLALLGVPVPQFSPVAPAGLIDVGAGRVGGSTAEAATAPGFATARADAALGGVKLFGGFVTVDAVSSEATVERGTTSQSSARSWLSGVQVAGIPVSVDATGLHVAGGGPAAALLTPVFDGLLGQLATLGITVRTTTDPVGAECCEVSVVGLEVAFASPAGDLTISLGGAQATAPAPLPVTKAATSTSAARPAATTTTALSVPRSSAVTATPLPDAVAEVALAPTAGSRPRVGMVADLGRDVVNALRIAYLMLVGAAVGAATFFVIAGPSRPARLKRGPS
jgi:hypothetical protein